MGLQAGNPLVGGTQLRRAAIASPNYVPGTSGWSINVDGSAEFRDIVLPEGSGGAIITIGAVAPASPHQGDLWLDTAAGLELSQWNGAQWVAYQWGTNAIADGAVTTALINFTARDIGGITTTVSAAAPASPQNGDLWYDSSNGYKLNQYEAGAWTAYQYGTDAIAAGSITAELIAANTITTAQLAAGIIYAGIVDGTTISAATFLGADFEVNAAGEFYYSGAPAAGNLIFSISNVDGTDAYGNRWVSGTTYYSGNTLTSLFVSYRAGGIYFGTLQNADGGTGGLIFEAPLTTRIVGVLAATNPSTGNSDEGWHNFTLASGWAAGTDANGTSYPPAYKLMPDGTVALRGIIVTPASGTVLGVAFNSVALASPYVPASGTPLPTGVVVQASGAHVGTVEIHPNGNVELEGNFTTSNNVKLDCTVRVS